MAQADVIISSGSYFKRLASKAAQDILHQFEPGHAFEKLGQWRLKGIIKQKAKMKGVVLAYRRETA